MDVTHILSLLNAQSAPFTMQEWGTFIDAAMPAQIQRAPQNQKDQWRKRQFDMVRLILNSIPAESLAACTPPPIPNGSYVAITSGDRMTYAIKNGAQYERVRLDASQKPHLKGSTCTPGPSDIIQPVELWDAEHSETESDDDDEESDAEPSQQSWRKTPSIVGPFTLAFPRNIGWHSALMPRPDAANPGKLGDLTISEITKIFTAPRCAGAAPNCIHGWSSRVPFQIDFALIFSSFGTPLSDASEDRQWRKMIHRATNVRGRHPDGDQRCRMCLTAKESMLHLFECMYAKPFWRKCLHFCVRILNAPAPTMTNPAIIFGLWSRGVLGPTAARAFLRHAFDHLYRHITYVDFKKYKFVWQRAYRDAVLDFSNATLRYARKLQLLHVRRRFTELTCLAPREQYEQFESFVKIEYPCGNARLSKSFEEEIERATNAVPTN